MKIPAFVVSVLLATNLAYADSAHTIRATDLHAESQSDAATLAAIPENTALDVLQRRGAWSQVKAGAQTGWVRMLDLRFDVKPGASNASGSSNPAGGLNGLLASGRTSNSGTDTTGVRGMTEEDLNKAQANPMEFQKMQAYASDKNTAIAFGKRPKLTQSNVPYFPEPAK
jgi:hypothetical protein